MREEELVVLLGRISQGTLLQLSRALRNQEAETTLKLLHDVIRQGCDLRQFCVDWLEHLRDLTILKMVANPQAIEVDLASENLSELKREAEQFDVDNLQRLFHLFSRTLEEIKVGVAPQWVLEMAFLKALRLPHLLPVEQVMQELERLEAALRQGEKPTGVAPVPLTQDGGAKVKEQGAPSTAKAVQNPPSPSTRLPSDSLPPGAAQWAEILRQVKERKPNLGSYLEQGILLSIGKAEVRIGYPEASAFLIPLVQKEENLRLIREMWSSRFGTAVAFRVEPLPAGSAPGPSIGQLIETERAAEVSQHPLVQEALKVFGGTVAEIHEA